MSAQHNLGKILDSSAVKDAIHMAIAPCIAAEELKPGENVGFVASNQQTVGKWANQHFGIVDPFLKENVKKDQYFYVFLYPNTVTSLRHEWEHPMFMKDEQKEKARKWLEDLLDHDYYEYGDYQQSYSIIKDFAEGTLGWDGGDHYFVTLNGNYTPNLLNEDKEKRKKFWDCLEIVTGKLATEQQRNLEYFSCSC